MPESHPISPSAAALKQAVHVAQAWAPANPVEDHLARKIASLGIAIENLLTAISALDPANEQHARRLAPLSAASTRLQKLQFTIEGVLREMQAQRGFRASHPLTCEPLPAHADARPYLRTPGSSRTSPVFKPGERLVASAPLPAATRRKIEARFGARVYPASTPAASRLSVTPNRLRPPSTPAERTPRKLRGSAPA
ncbi:MAG: hypothetical protein IT163_21240 [Bryobacterales bacterium]|nr:hypothetical protein [Bryobacterales bacterium]